MQRQTEVNKRQIGLHVREKLVNMFTNQILVTVVTLYTVHNSHKFHQISALTNAAYVTK